MPPPAYWPSSSGPPNEPDKRTLSPKNDSAVETKTPQRQRILVESGDINSDVDDIEFEDETLAERLIGLTEMFPDSVRRAFSSAAGWTFSGIKTTYSLSRSVSWFIASTATLCFLPLFLELERVQTEEQEAVHQRTMMLGPRAAGSSSGLAGFSAALPHLTPMESK